jgi:hypothetical protein
MFSGFRPKTEKERQFPLKKLRAAADCSTQDNVEKLSDYTSCSGFGVFPSRKDLGKKMRWVGFVAAVLTGMGESDLADRSDVAPSRAICSSGICGRFQNLMPGCTWKCPC